MKRLITLLAIGVAAFQAVAQDAAPTPPPATDSKPTAAQIDQMNKQLAEMRKQLDATQAQLKAMKDSGASTTPASNSDMAGPPAPEAPSAPEAPAAPRVTREGISRIGGSYTVAQDEIRDGDARVVGGSLTVDGTVRGDASAVGGSLWVNGTVDGDVSVSGGSLHLGPKSVVTGDVRVTGGNIDRAPGSVVNGDIQVMGGSNRYNIGPVRTVPGPTSFCFGSGDGPFGWPFPLGLAVAIFIIGGLLLTAAPGRIDTIGRAFVNRPAYSLLVAVVSAPVIALVSATCVGMFFTVPLMLGAFFMGTTAVAVMLGRRIALGKRYRSRFYPMVVGLGVWFGASVVSHMIPPFYVMMCIASLVMCLMAIGAALSTGLGKGPSWLRERMSGQSSGTPWVDPNYTYAGTSDAYRDIK